MAVEKRSPSLSKTKGKAKEQLEELKVSTSQVAARADTNTKQMEKHMSDSNMSIIEYADDLENAEAPPVLPASDYAAEIRGAEIKTGAQSGKKYVQVTFYISPDDYPADFTDGDQDGYTLSYGRLSPEDNVKARFQMKKFKDAIGAPGGKQLNLSDWIGLTAIVSVVNEPYDGVMQANIKKVNPA